MPWKWRKIRALAKVCPVFPHIPPHIAWRLRAAGDEPRRYGTRCRPDWLFRHRSAFQGRTAVPSVWHSNPTPYAVYCCDHGKKCRGISVRDARIALGRSDELAAELARAQARRLLAEVALEHDDMTLCAVVKATPITSDFVDTYWDDLSRVWKASTTKRNWNAWKTVIAPTFGGDARGGPSARRHSPLAGRLRGHAGGTVQSHPAGLGITTQICRGAGSPAQGLKPLSGHAALQA